MDISRPLIRRPVATTLRTAALAGGSPAEIAASVAAAPGRHPGVSVIAMIGIVLLIGSGSGSDLRRPPGLSVAGGLMVGQMLTLYTAPVIYPCLDRVRHSRGRRLLRLFARRRR